jgi:hypothetical protein
MTNMSLLLKASLLKLWHALIVSPVLATMALFITPLKTLFESEGDFFVILTMALLIDLLVGVAKYLKLNKFSFKDMVLGLIIKVLVAYGGLLIFLSFASLENGWISEWFMLVSRFTILLYPAGSALANMYVLTEGSFPPISFMKRLKSFEEVITPTVILIDKEINEESKS